MSRALIRVHETNCTNHVIGMSIIGKICGCFTIFGKNLKEGSMRRMPAMLNQAKGANIACRSSKW
jgi:hypothetical protein